MIVGGGPHGVCAGQALHSQGASIRIVEPSGRLLHRWGARAGAVGMTWMRSPVGHHLDAQPGSLHQFLHQSENAEVAELAGAFRRPRYDAFLRHSQALVARHRLDETVIGGRVDSIRTEREHLLVQGEGVEVAARRVLIATGTNVPRMPQWARRLQREGAPIHHAFGPCTRLDHDILGGGISAVQRALMVHRSTGQT
ncbi:FAD/NAD(P)-binding protein, partial [Planctomycetota bacterium]|nr:FAD/NAD(P)-binding protein [Planctomycetota bacterium]